MSTPDRLPARPGRGAPRRPRRRGERRLALALWTAIAAALLPVLGVVSAGPWVLGALTLSAVILVLAATLRRLHAPAIAVTAAATGLWAVAVTAVFFGGQALAAVIPTPAVFTAAAGAVRRASSEILLGAAPLEATAAMSFVLVASAGALTVILDHVVVTARMPLLAAIALVAVWVIPAVAVPRGVDLLSFVLLAITVLILLRAETRTREAPEPGTSGGVTTLAVAIGTVAVVVALLGAPSLPTPVGAEPGSGTLASIDPTLDLGDDLRRNSDVPVLTLSGDSSAPPYLRVATLSLFDGSVWRPDRLRSVSLDDGFEPLTVDDGVRVVQYTTRIDVAGLASAYLPLPYAAVEVTGLEGVWRGVPYSRTALSGQTSARGQSYEVTWQTARPTAEQIRGAEARIDDVAVDVTGLPPETPDVVAELAKEVTADASNDYDRLIALQTWFRGSEFSYSLDAPVLDGFDGTGSDAVAAFLEVKEGYCVHFAGAFALMARALEMPSRIVVGFLPGPMVDGENGRRVSEVTTSQLHAWPEVYFQGIGWVAFEPTKSLGTETRFLPESTPVDDGGEEITPPSASPSATAPTSTAAAPRPDDDPGRNSGSGTPMIDLRPYLTVLGIAVVILGTPMLARWGRRRWLGGRARRGDVASAWRMLQEAAIDQGIAVPAAESPRAFGARLVADHSAPEAEIARLVSAVERASYARPGEAAPTRLDRDADRARTAMRDALPPRARAWAGLAPRSLIIRPGSVLAGSVPTRRPGTTHSRGGAAPTPR